MRQFRKRFYKIEIPITLKNKLDLIKNIAKPPIENYRVSYAELIDYLIKILPSERVEVQPSRNSSFKDTTIDSPFEDTATDSSFEDKTIDSQFKSVTVEKEFQEEN